MKCVYGSKKGASDLIASVMLVLIAVAASVLVSGWLTSTTQKETSTIGNSTREQLECQYADMYVRSATYNCSGDCAQGTTHIVNVTIVNSGKKALSIDRIFIANTTGSVTEFMLPSVKTLQVGDTVFIDNTNTQSCSGINNSVEYLRVSSTNCPNAYDNYDGSKISFLNC